MAETREEKAVRAFLKKEGVDVEHFIEEKRTLMERKGEHGERRHLATLAMMMPPEPKGEEEES